MMNNSTLSFAPGASNSTLSLFSFLALCLSSMNIVFALPIHSYVIWLIVSGAGNGVASEIFILNLSVCEICICVKFECDNLALWLPSFDLPSQIMQGLTISGRPVFHCLICVERFLAVVHPVTFLKLKPLRYRIFCAALAWVFVVGSCALCYLSLVLISWSAYACFYLTQFFVFFVIQLFCCLSVLRILKKAGPGDRSREREEEDSRKRRAFNIILVTTVSMFFVYVPYILIGFYVLFAKHFSLVNSLMSSLCSTLAGFGQTFYYLWRTEKLQMFFRRVFKCCGPKRR